ncbi:MAG TPA: DNA mismatch repair protein MutS [Ktedonobacter sp.]|jgi:DNA mismatch repair protein MutS|nr:DNA mismatch repair protein MutS [Ktedonobacter sp.]HAG98404.1 DNA mismatch repair protein MutS [Ktedonobacter sp.]HAT45729.1 DNA mismatch repair protein MutS [Ktedonobacter sp.]HBE26981.1 DNA mismatch repair protein MutS [Ktedonobacter sp.]HCF85076.1 DNA mismatch repair protein MutS [Ktedonobacter sp.]
MSTPARRQYLRMKSQYPDAILMYQVGDFYETFDGDARIAARELQIVLTSRSYGEDDRVPLAGIPLHALENYVGKLVHRGYKVAICDQVGEVGRGIVERAVTRILTSGTLSEPNLLPTRQNNYLVAIAPSRSQTGLAAVDVSTGEFIVTWFAPSELPAALEAELQRLAPSECLVVEGSHPNSHQLPASTMTVTPCPPYFFEHEAARMRLCRLFGVQSLDAYGCAHSPQAIAAAGAIIAYLEKMNVALLSLLTGLRSYRTSSYMVLDAHTQRNLDLLQGSRSGTTQGSLLSVLDRTITPMGARQLRRTLTQPLLDLSQLEERFESVEELYESPALRSRFAICLQSLGDMERIVGRARQGSAVPNEVVALRDYLTIIPRLRELLQGCDTRLLAQLANELDPCPQVVELIGKSLARARAAGEPDDDERLIRAGFHAELDELIASISGSRRWIASLEAIERERTGIKSLKVGFNKVFGYYIEIRNAHLKFAPADYMRKQTLVNGERFITPELKEHEARILSATERIEEMERSIYADVLRQLSVYYPQLMMTAAAVARIDVLLCLAEVAAHQGYVRPTLEQGLGLEIVGGRHPVVEYTLDGDVFIPNDTRLQAGEVEQGERIVLLTGPNMAGKSTYLRQVALITLLAQIGSFVPARVARLGLVDRIFTRVGAEDDIASGKSTFMVEMEETATILHHATQHSLIILDEIGRGTSTYDGLAIARAVVEHLHTVTGARTLFATHYHELASMAGELPHLKVYTMQISDDMQGEIVFLHRVTPGCIGRSYGVHVAKLAGMPQSIVRRAEEVLRFLETGKDHAGVQLVFAQNGQPLEPAPYGLTLRNDEGKLVAEGNGHYTVGENGQPNLETAYNVPYNAQLIVPIATSSQSRYAWQSEEARFVAHAIEQSNGRESDLDAIDLCAITPLDALNLLFMIQKKRNKN